ncbi:36.4 kDa proline-rich protein-like, partial [Homarus americanus]|uniref:36.4 kDa proline-rich protein-like n=1 Tax=Homarus americanus TaxID=6706 RepID=UPI001C48CB90
MLNTVSPTAPTRETATTGIGRRLSPRSVRRRTTAHHRPHLRHEIPRRHRFIDQHYPSLTTRHVKAAVLGSVRCQRCPHRLVRCTHPRLRPRYAQDYAMVPAAPVVDPPPDVDPAAVVEPAAVVDPVAVMDHPPDPARPRPQHFGAPPFHPQVPTAPVLHPAVVVDPVAAMSPAHVCPASDVAPAVTGAQQP